MLPPSVSSFFFFNDTATTEIYTLSLHDALPICPRDVSKSATSSPSSGAAGGATGACATAAAFAFGGSGAAGAESESRRSEEHTSELQSQSNLVCRLLLEKKKKLSQWHRFRSCVI